MITHNRLRELLDYNPHTGVFRWKVRPRYNSPVRVGDIAGTQSVSHGYRQIGIDYVRYLEHRLAWLWMTGSWPHNEIDHINLNKADNRWSNIREATKAQNRANSRAIKTSGFKCVRQNINCSTWRADIEVNGRPIYLGGFRTEDEAHNAYATAAIKYFGKFARS